jgi:hypothetical protein
MLGDAFIVISPETSGFGPLTDVQVRKAISGLNPKVRVGADTKDADAAVSAFQARMKILSDTLSKLRFGADDKAAEAAVARLQAKLTALARSSASVRMNADTSQLDAAIAAENAKLTTLRQRMSSLQADADTTAAAARIAGLQKQAADLYVRLDTLDADVDITAALTKIYAIEAQLKVLGSNAQAVKLAADSKAFNAAIDASIARLAALKQQASDIKLGSGVDLAKLAAADAQLLGLEAVTERLNAAQVKVPVSAGDQAALADLARLQVSAGALSATLRNLRANANTTAAQASVAALQARMAALAKMMANLQVNIDSSGVARAEAQFLGVAAATEKLTRTPVTIPVSADDREALLQLAYLRDQVAALAGRLSSMRANADTADAVAKIAALQASAARLNASLSRLRVNVSTAGVATAEAQLLGLEAATKNLVPAARNADDAFSLFARGERNYAGVYGLLTGNIRLFGGALDGILPKALAEVGALHVLADAGIEIAAVWIPAAIALSAFGLAAAVTAKQIATQFQNIEIVSHATGQSIAPLTNDFQQLEAAVKPEVFQLFGEGLVEMEHNTGAFQVVAKATGAALDQLGARFVYATTQGQGISKFAQGLAPDFAKLGDSVGNFFGILGNLLKAVPGYAQILLSVGDSILHVIEVFTQAAEPIINFGLKLHGAILYSGLAVSAMIGLAAGVINLGKAFITFGTSSLVGALGALSKFGSKLADIGLAIAAWAESMLAADGAAATFGAAVAPLAAIDPLVWVGAAAIALGALVYWLNSSRSAAQQFNASMQQTIANAQLSNVATTIQKSQAATAAQLATAQAKLNQVTNQGTSMTVTYQRGIAVTSQALQSATSNVAQYTTGQQKLNTQAQMVSDRIAGLAQTYGSNTAALGALNAAGITTAQLLDTNSQHWATTLIQVSATTQAYRLLGSQTGTLGNDLDALGRTETAQYSATQKLNTAWSQFISDVTGSQGAFDTFDQGLQTLGTDGAKFTLRLGDLSVKGTQVKAAIDSLSVSGLNLNQAFTQQVSNTSALYETWRTAGIAGNEFTQGVKDSIAPLTKYAAGSQEATAQLVALAEQAGYQGPVSMKALVGWLGNTKNAIQGVKNVTNDATTQEALLTGAMHAQGDYISSTLIGDINQAILKYSNVQTAATNYGNAIAQSGRDSDNAQAARTTLINDLIQTGRAAGDTTSQIAAMIAKVAGIPAKAALEIVMEGTGSFTITQGTSGHAGGTPTGGRPGNAAGGMISSGTSGTADDVPVMVSRGEYIVKASSVAKYGKPVLDRINAGAFAAGGMPGFASGGLVQAGDTSVLSGQYAVSSYNQFQSAMTTAMTTAMKSALKSAESSAAASAAAATAAGVSNASGVAALKAAAAKHGWTSTAEWNALNAVELREAGYSLTATNPSSGAYGMAQFIQGASEYAQWGGSADTYAGQATAMCNYIAARYGDPIAAEQHEQAYGWYRDGGLIGPVTRGLGFPAGMMQPYGGPVPGPPGSGPVPGPPSDHGGGNTQGPASSFPGAGGFSWENLLSFLLLGGTGWLQQLLTQLLGTAGAGGTGSTGSLQPSGGGFGLTRSDLGLPATIDTSGTSAGTSDTGTSGAGSGTGTGTGTTAPAKPAGPNVVQKAAAAVVERLMRSYIAHNDLVQMGQAVTTLDYLGDKSYDSTLSQIMFLDNLLVTAQKKKDKPGEKAAEKLLSHYGVKEWKVQTAAKGDSARAAARTKVEQLMKTYVTKNSMATATQANSLLTHWGDNSWTSRLGTITHLDQLLLTYQKAKDTTDIAATETLLKQLGVRNFSITAADLAGATSGSGSSGGSGSGAGSGAGSGSARTLAAAQASMVNAYSTLTRIYKSALANPAKGSFLANDKTSITGELSTLAARQAAEVASYHVAAGSLTSANKSKLNTKVRQELVTAHDQALTKGEPVPVSTLVSKLNTLASLSKAQGGLVMDRGGYLAPGWNPPIWNGTGRPEPVGPAIKDSTAAGSADIVAELRALRSQLSNLTNVTAAGPARTGAHVAEAVNGAAAGASFRARYPRGGF